MKMEKRPEGWHELSESVLLRVFLHVPPAQRRSLALVSKVWNAVCRNNSELWSCIQVSLGEDFLQRVDVAALYRWFLARAGAVQQLEFEVSSPDCWVVICGVLGICGRQLRQLRVFGEGEGCYEPGGRAAWLALVPELQSLELENAADWVIEATPYFPTGLTRLELNYCGEEGLQCVPEHLSSLTGLVTLGLKGSQLDSLVTLERLTQCPQIQRLNLTDCCLEEVPPCLVALTRLTALTLSSNQDLGASGNELKVGPLAALKSLQLLEMRDCGLACVPGSITGLTNLRTLLLAMNAMIATPFILPGPYLPRLALLGLSDCFDEENGVTLAQLVHELEGATGLEVLRLNHNMGLRLDQQGLAALLRGKPHLRRLDFSQEMLPPELDCSLLRSQFAARFGVQLVTSYS